MKFLYLGFTHTLYNLPIPHSIYCALITAHYCRVQMAMKNQVLSFPSPLCPTLLPGVRAKPCMQGQGLVRDVVMIRPWVECNTVLVTGCYISCCQSPTQPQLKLGFTNTTALFKKQNIKFLKVSFCI